jgi:ribulose-phosphate 3-epimerase
MIQNQVIIAPSILSVNFANLQKEIEMINRTNAQWLHIDIMDGVFVPNISFGFPILKVIKQYSIKFLDFHLMIVNPEKYVERFVEAGANMVTIHYEAVKHLNRVVNYIKSLGVKAGVALNPHSNVMLLEDILEYVDMVCLMSVNPGFSGQEFIRQTYSKIVKLNELKKKTNNKFLIQVDGGINDENAIELIKLGANVLVAGNFIFSEQNPEVKISNFFNKINTMALHS